MLPQRKLRKENFFICNVYLKCYYVIFSYGHLRWPWLQACIVNQKVLTWKYTTINKLMTDELIIENVHCINNN
jgi:hypothetical protein